MRKFVPNSSHKENNAMVLTYKPLIVGANLDTRSVLMIFFLKKNNFEIAFLLVLHFFFP